MTSWPRWNQRRATRSPKDLLEWQENQLPAARGICGGDPRYLALPDKFDFHEYRHMEKFVAHLTDPHVAEQLWHAIKGTGAFRQFRDAVTRLGLLDDWYSYREGAMMRFMLDWADANNVPVDQTPRVIKPL
jgi:uncharacterized protein UPF0158